VFFLTKPHGISQIYLRAVSNAEAIALAFFVILVGLFLPSLAYAAPQNMSSFIPVATPTMADIPLVKNTAPDLLFGLFIGVMITASLYLFFIWAVIRDKGQFFLMLLLVCLVANMGSTNDTVSQLVGLYNENMRNLLQSYSMILAYFFSIFFTYYFLEIETNAPFMRPPLLISAGLLVLLLVFAAFDQSPVYFVLPILGVLALTAVLLAGVASLRARANGGVSHIIAFSALMIGSMAFPLYDMGFVSSPLMAKNFTYLGFSVAAMMFALVIAGQFASRQEEKEKALEVSNERFSLAAKGSNEGLFDWNKKTNELYISTQLRRILGVTIEATPKKFKGWLKLIHPADRRLVFSAVHKLIYAKSTATISFEYRIIKKDGETCWVHTKMVAVKQHNVDGIDRLVGSIGDITKRKHSESELKASEIRFRSITEAHPVPVLIATLANNEILYASPGAETLLGLPIGMIINHTLDRFISRAAERRELLTAITNGEDVNMKEVTITRGDVETIPTALSARLIKYHNQDAMVIGLYDLTERKKAEKQIAQQQEALQQSEKMAALGGLLAGVAHELNNPLSVVMGQTTLLMESQSEDKTKGRAEKIFKAADRCSRIVKSFLALARRKPPEHKNVDINTIIHSSLELLNYQFRNENVNLVLDLDPELPTIIGDDDQLTQVFTNLALNAAQAMHDWHGPHNLTIATRVQADEQTIHISVIDTGPGVPAEMNKRIFEPFFTTKGGTGGTGVGLALCVNIISAHGGNMVLEDTPGGGATFLITLPIAIGGERPADLAAPEAKTVGRKLAILLVDDEVELAQTLADLLEPQGHDIDLAANGAIALEKLRKRSFDVIISDLRMPVLDGPGLYEALGQNMPQYLNKIIYVTGDTLSTHVHEFLSKTPVPVIEKPYRMAEVQTALVKLLKENESQSNIESGDSISPAKPAG